ncbi:MAG: hypothetical protein JRN16_06890 [Nitrososphaerota archaeon]|nr:hypothetical protein [Nitrososphaerota archaeon]MDG7020193.1 hypothetical protein [Nitrososphaerota archaeon]MDG7028118.1 hypothetical protein [Nitrososphaerota archaeon]
MTFEEVEKRRLAALTGGRENKPLALGLTLVFLALTAAMLALIVAPVARLMPTDYAATAGVGGLAGLSLFALRLMSYTKKHGLAGSVSLAFLDVLAWVGVVGVLVWSFIFPVMGAFPANTMLYLFYLPAFPIGMYSLTFFWAMLVVLRVALQPFTKPPSERVYADIETSLGRLADTVALVGQRMKGPDQKMDPALAEKVSAIMSEVTAVRKELSTIKTTGPSVYAPAPQPAAPSVRVLAPEARHVALPRERVTVLKPVAETKREEAPTPASAPDSTADNPWLDVLSKRRAKKSGPDPSR